MGSGRRSGWAEVGVDRPQPSWGRPFPGFARLVGCFAVTTRGWLGALLSGSGDTAQQRAPLGYSPYGANPMLLDSATAYAQAGLNPEWKTDVAFTDAAIRDTQ